jgi:hypothetical protein
MDLAHDCPAHYAGVLAWPFFPIVAPTLTRRSVVMTNVAAAGATRAPMGL